MAAHNLEPRWCGLPTAHASDSIDITSKSRGKQCTPVIETMPLPIRDGQNIDDPRKKGTSLFLARKTELHSFHSRKLNTTKKLFETSTLQTQN